MHGRGRARSGGEALAAPGPPRLEHRATAASAHPEPETMGFLAFPVVGLERALHAWPPLRPRPEGGGRASSNENLRILAAGQRPVLSSVRLVGLLGTVVRSAFARRPGLDHGALPRRGVCSCTTGRPAR